MIRALWQGKPVWVVAEVRAPGLGRSLYTGLKAEGILVKSLHGAHPLLADCIRITVGSAEENQALLAALARRL